VKIAYYDDEGKALSSVKANEALLEEKTGNMIFNGDVQFVSGDSVRLFSEKLLWDEADEMIYSDAFVTVITAEGDTINGTGFESEKSLERWIIEKPWGTTRKKFRIEKSE
jgi:LPS export ABC transporter protein LptC